MKKALETIKCSFFNQTTVYQSFYVAGCLHLVIFYYKIYCVSAHVGKSLTKCLLRVPKTLSKKIIDQYISCSVWHELFIQMVKNSFPDERIVYQSFYVHGSHFIILVFLQGKLCVSVHVSMSLARNVFPCVKKMLPFGCVCSMKMGLLKHVSPVLFDKKTVYIF